MKRIFIDNAWNIWNIATVNKVSANNGMSYFSDNLRDYGNPNDEFHPGADEVDYQKLSAIWKSMTPEEQYVADNLCNHAFNDLYDQLLKLFQAGDRDGFEALLATYDWEPKKPIDIIK